MIPQLGFNHEDSGQRFVLDLADLHRDKLTIPAAFRAVPIEEALS
jgi:CRISPR-associated protein Cas1